MAGSEGRRVSKATRRGSTAIAKVDPPASGGVGSMASGNVEIEPEETACLAYLYWETRGCQEGSPEEDWLRAEQQLRGRQLAGGSQT
jgi:hypothetical protein